MPDRAQSLALAMVIALILVVGAALAVSSGVFVDGTITIDDEDGPTIEVVTVESEMQLDGPSDPGTVEIVHDDGTIIFDGGAGTAARIDSEDISGQTTRVTDIDAETALTIDPQDKAPIEVQDVETIEWGEMAIDDDGIDFSYQSSVESTVTLHNLESDTELIAVDADSGQVLGQATTDSAGSITFDELDSGDRDVLLSTTAAPTLSNASPSDDEIVSEIPVDLSIDVDDPDFDRLHGDEVTVTFYDADDEVIGSETVSESGTASTTMEDVDSGRNEWSVVAEDSYGQETQSDTFEFQTPSEIELRNESNPEQLIEVDGDATVTFFGEDEVFERDAEDGIVDMSGLPAEEFVISVSVDGFVTRQAIIDSILEQQTVYLLDEEADSAEVVFTLSDDTSRFPSSDTTLYIERPITRDGSTTYEVVTADEFGANEQMPARLLRDQRYRLRVVNDDGEQRVLGSYTVTESVVERLPIGSVIIRGDVDDEPVFRAELREGETPNTSDVRIAYIDQSETTDSLTISIEDDDGNALRETTTETGPFGVYQESLPLDDWDGESSIHVSVDADRGGEITTYDRTLGELENLGDRIAIDDDILQLMGYLSILMLMGLIVIVNPPLAALVGVIWAGLISAVGIVPISGLAIAVAGSVAVLFVAGRGQGAPV